MRLVINGSVQQVKRSTSFYLTSVDRGTPIAQVEVLDAEGEVLFSGEPSSFNLQRHSRLNGPARAKKSPPKSSAPTLYPVLSLHHYGAYCPTVGTIVAG